MLPFVYDYYPLLTFGPLETSIAYPEFFEDEPMILSQEDYERVGDEHDHVFKLWCGIGDVESHLRVVPKDSVHDLDSIRIDEIEFYLVSFTLDGGNAKAYSYFEGPKTNIYRNDFTFVGGVIYFDPDVYRTIEEDFEEFSSYVDEWKEEHTGEDNKVYGIFDVKVDKYQSVADARGAENAAMMQSVQSALMEYYYQAYLATESQQKLNEVAYTVVVTLFTTFCSGGAFTNNIYTEPLEECFLDPTSEAIVGALVRQCGGDKYAEIIATSLAESAREGIIGEAGSNQRQSQKQKQSQAQRADQSAKTGSKLQISSKTKLVLSSLAIFAGALSGFGLAAAIGLGAMGTISQIASYGVDKYAQLRQTQKEGLKRQKASAVDSFATVLAMNNPKNKGYFEAHDAVTKALNAAWTDIVVASHYTASKSVKAPIVKIALLQKLFKLKAELESFERFDLDGVDPTLLKLVAEQIVAYENVQEPKYSVFEVAQSAGLDMGTAQKQIMETLKNMFGSAEFAAEYYAKAFSKEETLVQFDDGAYILDRKSIDECNRFSFKQTSADQGEVVKEIYLPKGISVSSAKILVGKAFGARSSAFVSFYVGNQKIGFGSDSSSLYQLTFAYGGGEIEVVTAQQLNFETLNNIMKKVQQGLKISDIERSLLSIGAREMGGEEKIINSLEYNKLSRIRQENAKRCVIDNLAEKYGFDPSRIGDFLPALKEGSQLKYRVNRHDSNHAKLIKHLINLLYLYKEEIVQEHEKENTALGKRFTKTKNKADIFSTYILGYIFGVSDSTIGKWIGKMKQTVWKAKFRLDVLNRIKVGIKTLETEGLKNIYDFAMYLYNKFSDLENVKDLTKDKARFYEILSKELKDFPDRKVTSKTKLSELIGVDRYKKLDPWIDEYFTEIIVNNNPEYDPAKVESLVDKLKKDIWPAAQDNPITYEDIKELLEAKGAKFSKDFTKSEFESQKTKNPSKRTIKVVCEKGHEFTIKVSSMLYQGSWCSRCNEYKCETAMGWFMDSIFSAFLGNARFKKGPYECNLKRVLKLPTSMTKIITIDIGDGKTFSYKVHLTKQSFDGYLEFTVKGIDKNGKTIEKLVKIAFEYDGIQHDDYDKKYHYGDITKLYKQKCCDKGKNEEADFHDVYIIRLKEKDGFDFNSLNTFQKEIIRQFQELTGIKLSAMPRYYYDYNGRQVLIDDTATIDIPLSENAGNKQLKESKITNYLGDLK